MTEHKKTVIVTGGTKGIGASISRKFHAEGWWVILASRHESGLTGELGERARFERMDVREEPDHHRLVELALEWTGRLDSYINCAGISQWRPLAEIDEEFWNMMIDINLKGVLWGCKAAAESLAAHGSIINISSLASKRGSANNAVYCAAKFGVNALTQALAKELGPSGIRVNAVCPVYVATEGLLEALQDPLAPPQGQETSYFLAQFAKSNAALLRLPRGEEVADTCFYLASPAASAITGQCINVDCGVLPQ